MSLALMGVMYLLSLIPYLGGPLVYLLSPIPVAGMMAGCRDLELGRELRVNYLLSGFRDGASDLVTLGGMFVIAQILIGAIFSNMAGAEWQELMKSGAAFDPKAVSPEVANRVLGAVAVGTMLLVPVSLLLWFAPTLVILDGIPAGRAMVMSLRGCLTNVVPTLIYSTAMMLLLMLVLLTLGFGIFVWLPLAIASTYRSYRDIFESQEPQPEAPANKSDA